MKNRNYICFDCRKGTRHFGRCSDCAGPVHPLNAGDNVPKRTDDAGWASLRQRWLRQERAALNGSSVGPEWRRRWKSWYRQRDVEVLLGIRPKLTGRKKSKYSR